jgi:hypothetical protein
LPAPAASGAAAPAGGDLKKRTHAMQAPVAVVVAGNKSEKPAALEEDLAALLAQHNKKVDKKTTTYVPAMHSVKEIREVRPL